MNSPQFAPVYDSTGRLMASVASLVQTDLARLKIALEHSQKQRFGDALQEIKHIPDASQRVRNVRFELENDAPERAIALLVPLIRDIEAEAD